MRSFISTTSVSIISAVLIIFSFQNCAVPTALTAKLQENASTNDSQDPTCKDCGNNGSGVDNEDLTKKIVLTVQQNKLCYEVPEMSAVKSVYKKYPSDSNTDGPVFRGANNSSIILASTALYYGLRSRASGELVQCHKFERSTSGRILEIEKKNMSLEFDKIANFDQTLYTIDIIQNDCKNGIVVASSGALTSNDAIVPLEPRPLILGTQSDKPSSDYIMTTRLIAASASMELSKDKCVRDGEWESPECACDERHDPLIIDLSGQGIKLSALNDDGPLFDIQGINQLSRVGWTEAGSEMAFVVQDLNNDGLIGGGQEMFGDATKIPSGLTAANGFEALYSFDENKDLVIDTKDSIYKKLKLWTDRDHNGYSDLGELVPLSSKVKAIKLKYKVVDRDLSGNKIYAESTAILNNAQEVLAADVWFGSEIPHE